ncbi:MAG: hypothetical protein E7B29_13910 [Mixta calida]|uniref:hypothetical protein n=1 Tax=Mixta TaxID=2100764 RepID=UPI0016805D69|nr:MULTISPECIES: hypothetical protein [Mixta]MBS6059764.1 hypothetical protein [Pantoea sp.]MCR1566703.1 hypothetical protein [Mixta sp.]MDU3077370.1 hypothetical protein [Mixta calida]MDU3814875.1 hypothetical protein [Pantoea sp.]MDU5193166.1 hypothetical protein [Mixta calida]
MELLITTEIQQVAGAGGNYQMAVNLEIAQVVAAKLNNCNIRDLTHDMIASALMGGAVGAFGGSVAVPVVGSIPGWLSEAISGAGMGALTYGASCWW